MRSKTRLLIVVLTLGAFGVLSFGAFVLWVISSVDSEPSLTTNTDSASLASAAERVSFVSRYIKPRAAITDASFHIVYHDNSGGLPGPSDWNMTIVLRVNPADRDEWLDGARPAAPEDAPDTFSERRRPIPPSWNVSSAGEFYVANGTWLVWHPEGALERWSATS